MIGLRACGRRPPARVFYYLLLSIKPSALVAVIALVTLTVLSVNACWGMITAYINERFHTGVRASGFGLGYSLAVILPSFYAGYQDLLSRVMDPTYTPLPLLVIGGLLITLGAILGPETRDVDLADRDDVGEVGRSPSRRAASAASPSRSAQGASPKRGTRRDARCGARPGAAPERAQLFLSASTSRRSASKSLRSLRFSARSAATSASLEALFAAVAVPSCPLALTTTVLLVPAGTTP